jgi:hypothetical protein
LPSRASARSFLDHLDRDLSAELVRDENPYIRIIERALPSDGAMISSAAIAALIGVNIPSTRNSHRIAQAMRSLGYFPVRSRKLLPGGFLDTAARGWIKPKAT